ncbi:MAG: hypothetical protein GF344_01155 [Chitinivibrionales bacterium]|nr:hypothetical protein [Chitinivibrionales bacterium]MBD3355705.1 hypothetical protein [Chitinivibrionales bacterium]
MKKSKNKRPTPKRLTPARFLCIAALTVGGLVLFPLFTVWKQVYITSTSRYLTAQADSLAVLTRRAARLSVEVEKLSSTQRVETIAREHLDMDYPGSDRVVIVDPKEAMRKPKVAVRNEFLTVLFNSLSREEP